MVFCNADICVSTFFTTSLYSLSISVLDILSFRWRYKHHINGWQLIEPFISQSRAQANHHISLFSIWNVSISKQQIIYYTAVFRSTSVDSSLNLIAMKYNAKVLILQINKNLHVVTNFGEIPGTMSNKAKYYFEALHITL